MHNIIQELRGNVRVFARIRPYLPDDGKQGGEEDDVPFVSHEGDTIVTVVRAILLRFAFRYRWISHMKPLLIQHRQKQIMTLARGAGFRSTESLPHRLVKILCMKKCQNSFNQLLMGTMSACFRMAKLG